MVKFPYLRIEAFDKSIPNRTDLVRPDTLFEDEVDAVRGVMVSESSVGDLINPFPLVLSDANKNWPCVCYV